MYCTSCGSQINQNDNFCASCGTRVKNKTKKKNSKNQELIEGLKSFAKARDSYYLQTLRAEMSDDEIAEASKYATIILVDAWKWENVFGKLKPPTRQQWNWDSKRVTVVFTYFGITNQEKELILRELGTNLTVNDVYWVSGFSIYPVNNLLQKGWSCYSCDNMSFIMYPSDRSTIIKKAKIKFK